MAIRTILASLSLVCLIGACLCQDPPVYTKSYRLQATIELPYAEIREPITAYFDPDNKRSRVDYYGGVQRTYQLVSAPGLPYGAEFKVIPFTTQTVYNQVTCFQANGSQASPAETTSVLPDLTGFTFTGVEYVLSYRTNVFQKVDVVGKKVSTYKFWAAVEFNNAPLRYEMLGYDTLLGSHYDHYIVEYENYESPGVFRSDDFAVPSNLTCRSYPGPGLTHSDRILMNPVREFIHNQESHVHESFEHFKAKHNKKYSAAEHDSRKHVFRQNLRFIHSKNRAGLSYTMAVNHLADKTVKEMKTLRGFRYTHGDRGGQKFAVESLRVQDVPAQWDWRLSGAVTQVKDQAICGSCWSFGTTGTIEGSFFLKTGNLVRLSQQELIDCSWGQGNNGCDGGEDFRAYQFLIANGGLTTEEQYGQYLGIDSFCKSKSVTPVAQISNYTILPQGNLSALKISLYNKGPISVSIDASHKSFSFYANGVYYEPQCRSDPDGLDHSVLAVGYGNLDGQDYWLVKNSWSTYWGNDGYVLMAQKDNNCGVATAASFVDIK